MAGAPRTQTDDERSEFSSVVSLSLADLVLRAALPSAWSVTLPVLGHVTASFEDRQIRSEQVANLEVGCHGVALSLFGTEAILWVEKGLARVAVDLLLGRPTVFGRPTLSRIERGLLHGIGAGVATALGVPPGIEIAGVAKRPAWPPSVARIRVELAGAVGRVWLCASAEFVRALLKASMLESVLAIELASTVIPRVEVASARLGDAVVFDETNARDDGKAVVRLRTGSRTATAELGTDGRLAVVEVATTDGAVTKDERGPAVLNANHAEVTAEIGRFAGPELAALIERPVLGNRTHVQLRLEGAPWAEGDITQFDGRLAVRLTRLSAR